MARQAGVDVTPAMVDAGVDKLNKHIAVDTWRACPTEDIVTGIFLAMADAEGRAD